MRRLVLTTLVAIISLSVTALLYANDTPTPNPLTLPAQKLVQQMQCKEFTVVEIDPAEKQVYLATNGASLPPGAELNIIKYGDEITVNGKVVGRRETPIATLQWQRAQTEELGIAKIEKVEDGKAIEKDQVAIYKTDIPSPVVVLPLTDLKGRTSDFGLAMASQIQAAFAARQCQVVEAGAIRKAMLDYKIRLADFLDPAASRQATQALAQAVGARSVLFGVYTVKDRNVSYAAMAASAETGGTLTSARGEAELKLASGQSFEWPAIPAKTAQLFDIAQLKENCMNKEPMGSCPVGGQLVDDCMGYRNYDGGRLIFDLGTHDWDYLIARLRLHDTADGYNCIKTFKVVGDGRTLIDTRLTKEQGSGRDYKLPIKGVRMLRIDLDGGMLVEHDFQVLQGEMPEGAQLGNAPSNAGGNDALTKLIERIFGKKK